MQSPKAALPYEQSYLGRIRKMVQGEKLLILTVRAVILNAEGCVLFIRRSDNGRWAMPAGSMELEESIEEALKREVWEEAGLTVTGMTLFAVYSHPRFSFVTAHGDPYQAVSFVFRVDSWTGDLARETDETTDARFFPVDALPEGIADAYRETIEDLKRFEGTVILK